MATGCDAADLDLQAIPIVAEPGDAAYDLNDDGVIDFQDRKMWVKELMPSAPSPSPRRGLGPFQKLPG
jgi:hypothetical protein